MAAPLRGTSRSSARWAGSSSGLRSPSRNSWRWIFGLPFLAVCWIQAQRILAALRPTPQDSRLDPQNPWLAQVS